MVNYLGAFDVKDRDVVLKFYLTLMDAEVIGAESSQRISRSDVEVALNAAEHALEQLNLSR